MFQIYLKLHSTLYGIYSYTMVQPRVFLNLILNVAANELNPRRPVSLTLDVRLTKQRKPQLPKSDGIRCNGKMDDDRDILQRKFNREENKIHSTNFDCARDVYTSFNDGRVLGVYVLGQMQSGKTEVMDAIIRMELGFCPEVNKVIRMEASNIFVITGLSDKDWEKQTKERLPIVEDNVFHRGQFKKFTNQMDGKRDILILVDEAHIASADGMTMSKYFKDLFDDDTVYEKNIRIVFFSATPDATLQDMTDWPEESFKTFKLVTGEGYRGAEHFIKQEKLKDDNWRSDNGIGGVFDNECFLEKKVINEKCIERFGKIISNMTSKKYHIIRFDCTDSNYIENMEKLKELKKLDDIKITEYTQSSDKDGNETIENLEKGKKPDHHTFIVLKKRYGCAKTLPKEHLGIVFDTHSQNDSYMAQSLWGRMCGYDPIEHIFLFVRIESIQLFFENYNKGWENIKKWNSGTLRVKNHTLVMCKKTSLHGDTIGVYRSDSSSDVSDDPDLNIKRAILFVRSGPETVDIEEKNARYGRYCTWAGHTGRVNRVEVINPKGKVMKRVGVWSTADIKDSGIRIPFNDIRRASLKAEVIWPTKNVKHYKIANVPYYHNNVLWWIRVVSWNVNSEKWSGGKSPLDSMCRDHIFESLESAKEHLDKQVSELGA